MNLAASVWTASALALLGCSQPDHPQRSEPTRPVTSALAAPSQTANATAAVAPTLADRNLYDLPVTFVDQRGQPTRLDVFRSHPTFVAMFFASSPSACPKLIRNLKSLEEALTPGERASTRFLMITIDPENDDPAALRALSQRYGLDETRWTLLTGDEANVRSVAAVLGISYRTSAGTINHSSVVTLVGASGSILESHDGLAPLSPIGLRVAHRTPSPAIP